MSDFPNPRVDGLIGEYLRHDLVAGTAYRGDGEFHAEMAAVRRWLASMDAAMDAERIGEEVRERVLRTVVFGTPDPDVAVERMARRRRMAEDLACRPFVR
jgi:hypothetical protein